MPASFFFLIAAQMPSYRSLTIHNFFILPQHATMLIKLFFLLALTHLGKADDLEFQAKVLKLEHGMHLAGAHQLLQDTTSRRQIEHNTEARELQACSLSKCADQGKDTFTGCDDVGTYRKGSWCTTVSGTDICCGTSSFGSDCCSGHNSVSTSDDSDGGGIGIIFVVIAVIVVVIIACLKCRKRGAEEPSQPLPDGPVAVAKQVTETEATETTVEDEENANTITVTVVKKTPDVKLGISIKKKGGTTYVFKLFDESPFQGTGLKVGMTIVSINGTRCNTKPLNELGSMLRMAQGEVKIVAVSIEKEEVLPVALPLETVDA